MLALALMCGGCGTYVAHRLAQAPNTYPTWLAPKAPVLLDYPAGFLTNFPPRFVEVGPPPARLVYRIVPPRDYHLSVTATNWLAGKKTRHRFSFRAKLPGATNRFTAAPRGTVFVLHGYGEEMAAMAPWAIRLAQDGWRSVLVDLRGHGKSTGKQIYYGVAEARDLSRLLDELARRGELASPVAVMGHSYGAALALRWGTAEPRIAAVVAMAPYAELSTSAQNLRREYAKWFPAGWLRAGLGELPAVLDVSAPDLDTTTALVGQPVAALFVAGGQDRIAPTNDVSRLKALSLPRSEMLVLPDAGHEALPYYFERLVPPVLAWLDAGGAGERR